MPKTFSVRFVDARNGYYNHKLLEAESAEDVLSYMKSLGHTVVELEIR